MSFGEDALLILDLTPIPATVGVGSRCGRGNENFRAIMSSTRYLILIKTQLRRWTEGQTTCCYRSTYTAAQMRCYCHPNWFFRLVAE